jgi:hypothetical protein
MQNGILRSTLLQRVIFQDQSFGGLMKHIGHYDSERKQWVPEKLPVWFVTFLISMVFISIIVLAFPPEWVG